MSSAGALICRITGTPVNDSETKHDNRVAAETEPLRMVDDVHDRIHRSRSFSPPSDWPR